MKFPRILSTTSALALIASPALADVTAQQVWDDWQNVMGMYGIEVSTSGGPCLATLWRSATSMQS